MEYYYIRENKKESLSNQPKPDESAQKLPDVEYPLPENKH